MILSGQTAYLLSLPGQLTVRIAGDIPPLEPATEWLIRAYVPGAEIRLAATSEPADLTFTLQRGPGPAFRRRGQAITLAGSWPDNSLPMDLYHLLYSVLRVQWLQRRLYAVHAAAVASRAGATLLVGHSGSGKSTVSLKLVQQQAARLVSGNKTLVRFAPDGRAVIAAGTTVMTFRTTDLAAQGLEGTERVEYGSRSVIAMSPPPAGLLPIHSMALVKLSDGVAECRRLSPTEALHRLYPFFMDAVNADTTLMDGQGVFVGAAPVGAAEDLVRWLRPALTDIAVYETSGTSDYITERLATL